MLTAKQQWLFDQLGESPADEHEVRLRHRLCVEQYGSVKNFTTLTPNPLSKSIRA